MGVFFKAQIEYYSFILSNVDSANFLSYSSSVDDCVDPDRVFLVRIQPVEVDLYAGFLGVTRHNFNNARVQSIQSIVVITSRLVDMHA